MIDTQIKIVLLDEADPTNLGVTGNFSALMQASSAPFAMFASWDDLWYPDKVSKSLKAMKALENRRGQGCPLLIHTDLRMVDANLRELRRSVSDRLRHVDSNTRTVSKFLLENTAPGCAIITNRSLLNLAMPIPCPARCEDWWLALVASAFGEIEFCAEVCIDWAEARCQRLDYSSARCAIPS